MDETERKNLENARPLIEMGYHGVPMAGVLENFDKAEKMARRALSDLFVARTALTLVKIGEPEHKEEKEKHLIAIMLAEEDFRAWYKEKFGKEFELDQSRMEFG